MSIQQIRLIIFLVAVLAISRMLTDHSLRLIRYLGEDCDLAHLIFSFLFALIMSCTRVCNCDSARSFENVFKSGISNGRSDTPACMRRINYLYDRVTPDHAWTRFRWKRENVINGPFDLFSSLVYNKYGICMISLLVKCCLIVSLNIFDTYRFYIYIYCLVAVELKHVESPTRC